jgi:hypothetical protein
MFAYNLRYEMLKQKQTTKDAISCFFTVGWKRKEYANSQKLGIIAIF